MKLDLSRLKLHPRVSEVFYLQTKGNDNLLAEIGGKFLAPLDIEIAVENTGTIYIGRGNLKTVLQLPCSRCLREFSYPLETKFEMTLVENSQGGHYSPDEGFILFKGDEADIGSGVEEAVFMAIPISPLCREDCQGLCPICGQDQNMATCSCQKESLDPRWEKLKNLQ
jgi:uncharacterized protein